MTEVERREVESIRELPIRPTAIATRVRQECGLLYIRYRLWQRDEKKWQAKPSFNSIVIMPFMEIRGYYPKS